MNRLGDFTDRHLPEAEGMRMFGIPVGELTKDDLLACLVYEVTMLDNQRVQHTRDLDFLNDLRRK